MGDDNLESLSVAELRASLRHHAAREGMACEDQPAPEGGLQAVLVPSNGGEETYFAVSPPGSGYVSLSLVLVVDREFFLSHFRRILDVTSRYDTCVALAGDEENSDGEAWLHLTFRVFREGWNGTVFSRALRTLDAAKDSLAKEFP